MGYANWTVADKLIHHFGVCGKIQVRGGVEHHRLMFIKTFAGKAKAPSNECALAIGECEG
jgi:hypothetical protein